jgi:hypothetical protein
MRVGALLVTAMLVASAARDAHACEVVAVGPMVDPVSDPAARAVATVIGYGVAVEPAEGVARAPSLRVRFDEIVKGDLAPGEGQVVVLAYGPDCRTQPDTAGRMEQVYPVGSRVVVRGRLRDGGGSESTLVVETNTGTHFAAPVPAGVPRIPGGDLDFRRFDYNPSRPYGWQFVEFEFDRAILKLPSASPDQRRVRLQNLAFNQYVLYSAGAEERYARLVSQSGVPAAAARELIDRFRQLRQMDPVSLKAAEPSR